MIDTAPGGQRVGDLLRRWREHRRVSQLELAMQAEISSRHLSFVETSRAKPSRDMVMHLAEHLDVPLRERNGLLLAAGFAPVYGESELASPQMGAIRDALQQVLAAHEPFPAMVVDRHWNLVDANACVALLTMGSADELLSPPVNVLRLSFHPDGMARRILNLREWRVHVLERLRRQISRACDPQLAALYDELQTYPSGNAERQTDDTIPNEIAVRLRVRHGDAELALLSTVTTFGTPLDITLAELAIESFYPADRATAEILREAAQASIAPS